MAYCLRTLQKQLYIYVGVVHLQFCLLRTLELSAPDGAIDSSAIYLIFTLLQLCQFVGFYEGIDLLETIFNIAIFLKTL